MKKWKPSSVIYASMATLPYACEGALAYRLVAPHATHYFIINDGPAKEVALNLDGPTGTCTDALSGEELNLDHPVPLSAKAVVGYALSMCRLDRHSLPRVALGRSFTCPGYSPSISENLYI